MCEHNPNNRISSFEEVKRSIQNNEVLDDLFTYDEINVYQSFASSLSKVIISVYDDVKYITDIELIQKKLSDLYKSVMLEYYIPNNTSIIDCFLGGRYRYLVKAQFETSILKNFCKFLKSCTKDKKNIVLSNLHSRFASIQITVEEDLISEDEIPF